MKCLKYLIIALALSNAGSGYSEEKQGIYVPAEKSVKGNKRIVRITLGDNDETAVINIGPQGPLVLVFPGNISECNMSSSAFNWKIASSSAAGGGGKEEMFKEVIFNISLANLSEEEIAVLRKEPAAAVCKHEDLGKTYYREILLRLNEVHPHRVVFFEYPERKGKKVNLDNIKGFQYIKIENGDYQFLSRKDSEKEAGGSVTRFKIKDGKVIEGK